MTESENTEPKEQPTPHETIRFGVWNVAVSKETMRQLVPYLGWSFLITSAGIALAALYWGAK